MNTLARLLIASGLLLLFAGIALLALHRMGLPLGRLPGDITWRGRNGAFYFPITTCILLSLALSFLFYLLEKLRR